MKLRAVAGPLVALLALTAPAVAQESRDEIARREILTQAEQARAAGEHTRALDLAGRAGRMRMTASIRLMMAQEHNALGHVLDALDHAGRCVREVEGDASVPNRDRILSGCTALVTSLRARVGMVTVHVPDPAPGGLRVRVQGGEVAPVLWGIPYPVLPGAVVIEANGDGDRSFRREVNVEGGGTAEVTIDLRQDTSQTSTHHPPPSNTVTSGAPPSTGPTPPVEGGQGSQGGASHGPGVGPWLVGGAGVVAMGVAGALYALRGQAITNETNNCNSTTCSPAAAVYHSDARTYDQAAAVTLWTGAAAVVGGVAWLVFGRSHAEAPPRSTWNLQVAPTHGGWTLGVEAGL